MRSQFVTCSGNDIARCGDGSFDKTLHRSVEEDHSNSCAGRSWKWSIVQYHHRVINFMNELLVVC
jgi:hypothetical protein